MWKRCRSMHITLRCSCCWQSMRALYLQNEMKTSIRSTVSSDVHNPQTSTNCVKLAAFAKELFELVLGFDGQGYLYWQVQLHLHGCKRSRLVTRKSVPHQSCLLAREDFQNELHLFKETLQRHAARTPPRWSQMSEKQFSMQWTAAVKIFKALANPSFQSSLFLVRAEFKVEGCRVVRNAHKPLRLSFWDALVTLDSCFYETRAARVRQREQFFGAERKHVTLYL